MEPHPTAGSPGTDLWGWAPGLPGCGSPRPDPSEPGAAPLPFQPSCFPAPSLPWGTAHKLGTSSPCIEPGQPCLGWSRRTDRLRREGSRVTG